MRTKPCACALPIVLLACANVAADDALVETPVELRPVAVIGATPLPGVGLPVEQVPANVQQLGAQDIRRAASPSLAQLLERELGSVNLNEAAENPFEPDLNFRGFTASPLLGTPEGISVYVDGVRANEAFGDIVNWDFLPQLAVRTATLIPGSNPLFGLNTLGGSINLATKSGFDSAGFDAALDGGSFGRRQGQAEGGRRFGPFALYGTANLYDESGWRDHSYSRVRQLFARADWRPQEGTRASVSYTGALNRLSGTQALPQEWLDEPKISYTWPDYERNQLGFFNLNLERDLDASDALDLGKLVRANLYYRKSRTRAFDSNTNDDYNPSQPSDPVDNAPGVNELSDIVTRRYGFAVEFSSYTTLLGQRNVFTLGVADDLAATAFAQDTQPAEFIADHDDAGSAPFTPTVRLSTRDNFESAYFSETLSFGQRLGLNAGGRYMHAQIRLSDEGSPASASAGSLSGGHEFGRFNPSLGLTYAIDGAFNAWAAYNESERVPSPVELSCADPAAPCSLPNDFLADPALKPVIARTIETGLRGRRAGMKWDAALFRTISFDDILFVSGGGTVNAGYFQNIPRTRRQGLELGVGGKSGKLEWNAHYSYIAATYRVAFTENSSSNSSADAEGNVRVRTGARIPGIPRHALKLRAEYEVLPGLALGANLRAYSARFARGDENNGDARGPVPGYTLIGLEARWSPVPHWELSLSVDNALDRSYQTLGVLGENAFAGAHSDAPNTADNSSSQFRSPGAPIGVWAGLSYHL